MIAERVDGEVTTSRETNLDRRSFRKAEIDPFGIEPRWVSRIGGLGGCDAPPDTSYVFRTVGVSLSSGTASFLIRFQDLQATTGVIVVQVTAASEFPGADAVEIKTVTLSMGELCGLNGEYHVEFIARRNMIYAVAGNIYDETDASASGLSVTVRCDDAAAARVEPVHWGKRKVAPRLKQKSQTSETASLEKVLRLLNTEPPSLVQPVSQGWTMEQCVQPPFAKWVSAFDPSVAPTPANWEVAYTLQVLLRYGVLHDEAAGLGFGPVGLHPLPAMLASLNCRVLAAGSFDDHAPGADPALALETLLQPRICEPEKFYDRAHFTLVDPASVPASLAGFDFAWSIRMSDRMESVSKFQSFIDRVMGCLLPGGIAVHLFRLAHLTGKLGHGAFALSRSDLERMVLALIAQGHEVAQLKFGYRETASLKGRLEIPFGLIIRRALA